MFKINISDKPGMPRYKQIVEQIQQSVAGFQLKPGERVPTVRDLARTLHVNPATVARAYQELEQQGILGASRRRGTIVMGDVESPQRMPLRQSRLAGIINRLLLDVLSQGYTPEELEAAFDSQLAGWKARREKEAKPDSIKGGA